MDDRKAKGTYIFCACAWSLIALFRRGCAVSSGWLAAWRSLLGVVTLLLFLLFRKEKLDWSSIRKNGVALVLSGAFLGLNWIAFMEALAVIPVSIATILYNLEAIFVLMVSPFLLHEKLTLRNSICVSVALVGMALTSGIVGTGAFYLYTRDELGAVVWQTGNVWGVVCALLGAVFFAAMTVANKKMSDIGATERTIVQFSAAFAVTFLYACLREPLDPSQYDPLSIVMTILIGVVMTGIIYRYYFDCLSRLSSRTIAIWSYMNPLGSVIIGVLFLHEQLNGWIALGGLLILGSTFLNEVSLRTKKKPA